VIMAYLDRHNARPKEASATPREPTGVSR